jgi:tRNA modification GTPase
VSTVDGRGLGELRRALRGAVFVIDPGGAADPVVTSTRQRRGVERARDEVGAFAEALAEGVPPEVASAHLRDAETALEEVIGLVDREEVLNRLFRDFCIGK